METDFTSIIIAVIASLAFFGPIVYFEYFRKRVARKFAAGFRKESGMNGLNLTQYDIWSDKNGIGIDAAAKKMIFHSRRNGRAVTLVEDLNGLKRCRVVKEDAPVKTPDGDRRMPARVDLQLEFSSPDKKNVYVGFYKRREGDEVADEVLLAVKWAGILNAHIRKH